MGVVWSVQAGDFACRNGTAGPEARRIGLNTHQKRACGAGVLRDPGAD
jgi:hypothetical protein